MTASARLTLALSLLFAGSSTLHAQNNPATSSNTAPPAAQRSAGLAAAPGTWQLVWSDEFSQDGLPDTSKWSYDVGGRGWGNHELEYYTNGEQANAHVKGGLLYITARKEKRDNLHYTSARMVTKYHGDWLYGRVEVRAKLPAGRGLWPAIWMLSTDWKYGGWPESGEIDIMENVGFKPDSLFGSVHTKKFNHRIKTNFTRKLLIPDMYTQFHVYAVEWYKDRISFYADSTCYATFTNNGQGWEAWPFDQRFHLILNLAVGGDWGGEEGVDDSIFPRSMVVDYVRVYQQTKEAEPARSN